MWPTLHEPQYVLKKQLAKGSHTAEQCNTCFFVVLHNMPGPLESHLSIWVLACMARGEISTVSLLSTDMTDWYVQTIKHVSKSNEFPSRIDLKMKEVCERIRVIHTLTRNPLPQERMRRKQDNTELDRPVCLSFSACRWWPCLTLYPFWKRSPQDFFRLHVSWTVTKLASQCVRRYTSSLGGIIVSD